jgi:glycine/D-amino acid oxidase-like deaminating enzyme
VRVGIIGAGLAGALLAWRVRLARPHSQVDLISGSPPASDATEVSGGLVRGFEVDPGNRELATESLAELHASELLTTWSGYQEIGSIYACAERDAGLDAVLAQMDRRLPGSTRVVAAAELMASHGWAGLPATSVAVVERRAGYVSPQGLRRGVLHDLLRLGVRILPGVVSEVLARSDSVRCIASEGVRDYDTAVVAAGRWTAGLLAHSGFPADGYRSKAIQYGVYCASGLPSGTFIDDTTGLYGRPAPGSRVLLGLPSDRWDVDCDHPPRDDALQRRAAELAAVRFPRLRLAAPVQVVAAADCYTYPPRLALRPVPGGAPRLYTFTGGSGGAAKTALAASRIAAGQLIDALEVEKPSLGSGSWIR